MRWDALYSKTSDGGYVIVGSTTSFGAGGNDTFLLKVDATGIQLWNRSFGGAGDEKGYAVQHTPDGGYIIAGVTSSFGSGDSDAWLLKTDENGVEQWNNTYGSLFSDKIYALDQTDDGYILAGEIKQKDSLARDMWMIKTDVSGNEMWSKTFGNLVMKSAMM